MELEEASWRPSVRERGGKGSGMSRSQTPEAIPTNADMLLALSFVPITRARSYGSRRDASPLGMRRPLNSGLNWSSGS
jgi:hypothetical protein